MDKVAQVKKDTESQYAGKKGVVVDCPGLVRYDVAVQFPDGDTLGFYEDELTFPRSAK